MKTKFKSKLLSILLVLIMVLLVAPLGALTVFAAGPTEIEELTLSFMTPSEIPAVGETIRYMSGGRLTEDDDRIELTGNILLWCMDDSSTIINNTYDDTGMYYEAGRTYNSEIVVEVLNPDQYTIGENTKITLTNPGDFTYTSEVSRILDTGSSFFAHIKLTITMNGERAYPNITKVVFKDLVSPTEGMSVTESSTDIHYSNCQMTSGFWMGNVWGKDEHGNNTFVAGETYTYRVVLTARDGYKFDENATIQMTSGGVAKEPSYYAYTNESKTLTLDYTYTIPSITWVDCVEATIKRYEQNLTPIAGEGAIDLFTDTLEVDENAPYEVIRELGRAWYSEDGTKLGPSSQFEAGKTYYFEYAYSIKDEYRHLYRFVPDNLTTAITGDSYSGKGFQKAERVEYSNLDDTYVKFRYYFTAQFPSGIGSSASNPAYCYSYEEFKFAMEDPNIRYVALGNVDETMPRIDGDGLIPAISVNGIKHLNVIGNATFTAPANDDGYKIICALLHTEQGDTLTVSGAGKLKFRAVANSSYNAVIYNQGGSVIIDSNGALIGSYNTAVYGKAIWQEYGELRISGGEFFAENALAPGSLPQSHSAVYIYGGQAWIQGGTFKTESHIDTIDLHYGLDIGQYATVDLSGGTFYGILLPKSSTPLANYMDEDIYTPFSNESWFNPKSEYSQEYVESGKVTRIAWLIDHVDIHVNAPIAGVDIKENYFNIPTSGCKVTMYYPQWYKNGESVTYGTFEAGANYKVVVWVDVKADYGAEFSNGVTVAINNQSVAVDRKSEHLIAVEYDFGACPNVVPQVELTVTAPKEGNKPSYSISCGSDAYYAVGGSSNYTEYRQWYMSSDNDDWWEINGSHQFMAGYYYKLVVDIRTNEGYEFPLYDNGSSIMPDVNAYVNNYAAKVIKAYDQDPSRYITVEYNFGECSDSIVEKITVENVTAPVAGQKPNYNWSIRGTGYQMDTTKNAYYDVYWKNPPEQWYYIKNGLGWFDVTDYDWVYENETFIAGHEYEVRVYVITEDGFEFAHNNYYEHTVTATVNGNTAEAIVDGSYCVTTQQIEYTFTCEQKEITTIMLYDLDLPVGGNVPDTSVTPAYPEYYVVESVRWFDIEDNPVGATFETGVPYYALITVASAKISGADIAKFADVENLTVYLDGNVLDASAVEDNKVTIPVIIRKPSSAPEMTIYAFTTQPSGGTVNAGESLNVAWQTSFIPTSTEIQYWDGEAWDQWDIQYPQNALDDYDFESHEAASYRFRIVAYIGSDAVVTSNEFAIVWEEDVVNEYIYVYTPGEGNGSNDFDYVTSGTQITLYTPESLGFVPIEGFVFDYWSVRKGTAQNAEVAQKQPGETMIINDNTYIVAIWKEAPVNKYTVAYGIGEGSGSADSETDIAFGSSFTLKAFGDVGIIAPEGKEFDYWSIRVGSAQSAETAQKKPGDTIIINDNTYIIAMWKAIPHTCVGLPESGQGATCTENGWKDYYRCECGNYYEDANCQTPISDLEAWKAGAGKIAASHDYGALVPAIAEKHTQTELVAGVAAHYHCSVCDTYFTEGKVETTLQELTGTTPSHSFGDWKNDTDKHWKECSCGKKSEEAAHTDTDTNNKCDTCGKDLPVAPPDHEHNFVDGKCECGETDPNYQPPHEHNFVDGKCECGETDPNYQPPHEHTFVDGKCECGETDPDYTPGTDEPGTDEPGTDEPGTDEPGTDEPGTDEPGTDELGTDEPGTSAPQTPADNNGLGTGAIVGIVIGSVAVVGIGGFALLWFAIKKKSFADLIAVFKKK